MQVQVFNDARYTRKVTVYCNDQYNCCYRIDLILLTSWYYTKLITDCPGLSVHRINHKGEFTQAANSDFPSCGLQRSLTAGFQRNYHYPKIKGAVFLFCIFDFLSTTAYIWHSYPGGTSIWVLCFSKSFWYTRMKMQTIHNI